MIQRNNSDFIKFPVAFFALEFLELLSISKPPPKNAFWDIASRNQMSISGSGLFRRMRVIERTGNPGEEAKWFVLDFKEAATVPWMVAVPNVICVCRLDRSRPRGSPLTDFKVARELFNDGIQFSILLPVKPLPRSIGPIITVPMSLKGRQVPPRYSVGV